MKSLKHITTFVCFLLQREHVPWSECRANTACIVCCFIETITSSHYTTDALVHLTHTMTPQTICWLTLCEKKSSFPSFHLVYVLWTGLLSTVWQHFPSLWLNISASLPFISCSPVKAKSWAVLPNNLSLRKLSILSKPNFGQTSPVAQIHHLWFCQILPPLIQNSLN